MPTEAAALKHIADELKAQGQEFKELSQLSQLLKLSDICVWFLIWILMGCGSTARDVVPAIENQPYIRTIKAWGDTIAVLTETYLPAQRRFTSALFTVNPVSKRIAPFTQKSCQSIHDIAISDNTLYLICEEHADAGILTYGS